MVASSGKVLVLFRKLMLMGFRNVIFMLLGIVGFRLLQGIVNIIRKLSVVNVNENTCLFAALVGFNK